MRFGGRAARLRAHRSVVVVAILVALLGAAPRRADAAREVERTFAQMVNDTRALTLLPPLQLRERLTDIARRHSRRMAERGELFHSNLERLLGNGRTSVAENVAFNGSLDGALTGLVGSPPHLTNMLGDFDRTGVGVVRRDGYLWITQIFVA